MTQTANGVLYMKPDGSFQYLKPIGGIIADTNAGVLRTAINAGLRGTVGYLWGVNANGDGQNVKLDSTAFKLINDPSTGELVLTLVPRVWDQGSVSGDNSIPAMAPTAIASTAAPIKTFFMMGVPALMQPDGSCLLVVPKNETTNRPPSSFVVYRNSLRLSGTDYTINAENPLLLHPKVPWFRLDPIIVDFFWF